ncbi:MULTISPECIES: hypothetical protein [unclassified Treponema]|uniref:hypothetical protein n=1 Tax=unclassified Treponema TaxID=2638727 RepID=UPI0020A45277|nr:MULTISPECIES: hypothetical protein [unclassified Treponema]UTC67677.1 hypothetical protein E4O06_03110 [Treponema sp. OMZ 789]UTC70405.1 hypothetical protein E4O01_03100 [Treponema sp. OMZ 790]UTC73119.1 hypothetical protein E4O02_03100 [Treponema sp. OMZ 791]
MKKILFFILVLVLTVSSCNLFVNEEYGELILSFDGTLPDGARALDSNGLPVLSSTDMKIKIVRENGYTIIRELAAEESKSLIELVPIGEKIEITVTASNASSQWSGKKTHTVTSGRNQVIVLLSKKASGLNKLLFTQTKVTAAGGATSYDLTLYMDGKPITVPQSTDEGHIFARDSLGRLYVRYSTDASPPAQKLIRYTSEGDGPENISLPPAPPITPSAFMNDFTTGITYVVDQNGSVYKIEENAVNVPHLTSLTFFKGQAAIDNNRVAWFGHDNPTEPKIYVKNIDGTGGEDVEIKDDIKINDCKNSEVTDIFIRNGYAYVLFKTGHWYNNSIIYAFGGVVRYNINNLDEDPVKIGFTDPKINTGNHTLYKPYDYSNNFYGAVKVIGFDEDNIYIADDGFDAVYDGVHQPTITANRNRIAVLNMETNALSFTDAAPAKWFNEW